MGINDIRTNSSLDNQSKQLPKNPEELQKAMQAIDTLIALVTDKPGIKIEKKENTLEISTSGLFNINGPIDADNQTKLHIRKFANEINKMIRNDYIDSVDITTFVGKDYIKRRIENYPESDIEEGIEDACKGRSFWAKQWITNPTDETKEGEPLGKLTDKIHIVQGAFVSDKKDLTYTINFESTNK